MSGLSIFFMVVIGLIIFGFIGFWVLVFGTTAYDAYKRRERKIDYSLDYDERRKAFIARMPDYEIEVQNLRERIRGLPSFVEAYCLAYHDYLKEVWDEVPVPEAKPRDRNAAGSNLNAWEGITEKKSPAELRAKFIEAWEEASFPEPADHHFLASSRQHFAEDTIYKQGVVKIWRKLGESHICRYNELYADSSFPTFVEDSILRHFLTAKMPVALTKRTQHMHIVGSTGSGKTNLLEYMIARDLADGHTVVVIDSQRQMIPKLASLKIPLEQVAYVSPRHDFGVNFFDVRLGGRSLIESELLINTATDLLEYIMGELLGVELTEKQRVPFQLALQLMMVIPNANIHVFWYLMKSDDPAPFLPYLDRLPFHIQHFFKDEFWGKNSPYKETKKEIGWRIWSLIKNPTFNRLFGAKRNAFVMDEEIRKRRLILIDTDQTLLKRQAGAFGRIFIAQLLHSAHLRFEGQHKPVYLYVDEAYSYFDDRLTEMLETARKANLGLILAHQHLGHRNIEKVLPALKGVRTKMVGRVDPDVARAMAAHVKVPAEEIMRLPEFHFVLNAGDSTYTVTAPHDVLADMPRRTDDIQAEMERRYGRYAQERAEQERRQQSTGRDLIIPDILDADYETFDDDDIKPSTTL